mgnify:CR=1 FL=1
MPRGIDTLDDQLSSESSSGSFIYHVRLKESHESAVLRFLTEVPDMFWESFHRVRVPGNGGREFWRSVLCPRKALGEYCEYCAEEDWPRKQVMLWAFEREHLYPKEVPGSTPKKLGRITVYSQEVNRPRLFRYGIQHATPLLERHRRMGTVTDRDFEWCRIGPPGDMKVTYSLEPCEPSPLTPDLAELAKTLPGLEQVAMGQVNKLSEASGEEARTEERPSTRTRPVAPKVPPRDAFDEFFGPPKNRPTTQKGGSEEKGDDWEVPF